MAEALRTHKKRLVPGDAYWTTMQEQFGYDEEGIIPELPIPVGDSEPSSSNQTFPAIQRRSGNSTQARRSGLRRRGRPTSATRPTRGSRRGRGRSRATHRRRIQLGNYTPILVQINFCYLPKFAVQSIVVIILLLL